MSNCVLQQKKLLLCTYVCIILILISMCAHLYFLLNNLISFMTNKKKAVKQQKQQQLFLSVVVNRNYFSLISCCFLFAILLHFFNLFCHLREELMIRPIFWGFIAQISPPLRFFEVLKRYERETLVQTNNKNTTLQFFLIFLLDRI